MVLQPVLKHNQAAKTYPGQVCGTGPHMNRTCSEHIRNETDLI